MHSTSEPPQVPARVPSQRRSELDQLGLQVEELVVAEHDARDSRLFDALEWATRH